MDVRCHTVRFFIAFLKGSAFALLLLLLANSVIWAQTLSFTGSPLTENFDGMGATGTNIPPGWSVGWVGPGVTFTTNVTVNSGTVAPNEVAGWNFGTAGSIDRALGTMATSGGTPAPPGTNRFIEASIRNNSGTAITAIIVRYDGEEWRTGSSGSVVNSNVLQFSADGDVFADMGPAFNFVQRVFTPLTTALDGNAAANRVTNIGGIYTLPESIPDGGVLYLRWFDFNDIATDPGMAIDNFSFSVPSVSPVAITKQPGSAIVADGDPATFSVTASGFPVRYQWFRDSMRILDATNSTFSIPSVTFSNAGTYSVLVTNQLGGTMSSNVTLAVVPAYRLISLTNEWSYNQNGAELGSAWKEVGYDDSDWQAGLGVLAFENAVAVTPLTNTVLALTDGAGGRIITYYFRTTFVFTNDPATVYLVASNLVDDGAIFYLNGSEVYRINMPSGAVTAGTLASSSIGGADEGAFARTIFGSDHLIRGTNVLAVEVHQADAASSDVVFGLVLRALPRDFGPAAILRHPVDQAVNPGGSARFEVEAVGTPPLRYFWRFNGVAIPGATNSALVVTNARLIDDGFYSVRVANGENNIGSQPARLHVNASNFAAFYKNDFEGAIGAEWSRKTTSSTPNGQRRFLGEFGNETIFLMLNRLPPHTNVTVECDLFLIRSWDGTRGFDQWQMWADNTLLIQSVFQVHTAYTTQPFPYQTFPDPFPGNGSNVAFTGAAEVRTLGYYYNSDADDAVYHLVYSCRHTSSTLSLNFFGFCDEPLANESWGVDNVKVYLGADASNSLMAIVTQPQPQSAPAGSNVVLSVSVAGPASAAYQWFKDGVPLSDDGTIAGSQTPSLTIAQMQATNAGVYTVAISNAYGSVISAPAVVSLGPSVRLAIALTNGLTVIDVAGPAGTAVTIETSSVITNGTWTTATNLTLGPSSFRWLDGGSGLQMQRFYRARVLP